MQYLFAWTILGTIVLMKQTYGFDHLSWRECRIF